jgi:mRNA interferase MazF
VIDQGDIWWLEEPDEKPRPCLVITRARAIPVLNAVMIAPITRTTRGIDTELRLNVRDGVRSESVAQFDNVRTVRRVYLTRLIGRIAPGRWHEVCEAMRTAIGC